MNTTILIISCVLIAVILIIFPLIISRKAENTENEKSEWEKIKDFGNKINKKSKNK